MDKLIQIFWDADEDTWCLFKFGETEPFAVLTISQIETLGNEIKRVMEELTS